MVPFLIVVIVLLVVGAKTKPDSASLRLHLIQRAGSGGGSSSSQQQPQSMLQQIQSKVGGLTRLLVGGEAPRIPSFTIQDLVFFAIGTTDDGLSFLGIFGSWYELGGGGGGAGGSSSGGGSRRRRGDDDDDDGDAGGPSGSGPAEEAEGMRETAVQMKAKRDYVGAAGLFVKAGEKFASAANAGGHLRNHALLQAGKCFEDAVGCFGLVKMEDRAITARERAAEVFAASEHTMSRAARLYETLGDDAAKKSPSLGLNYYRKAVSCFDAANDKRSLSVNAKIAEQLAILRDYKEAILIFDNCARDSADDRVLRFSVKTYVFNALLCTAGQKDDVRFAKGVENYLNRFPMCEDYSEAKVFGDIANAWINRDVARFDAVVGRFKSISSPPLAQWQDAALSAARDALLADAGSLR